jgi:hypothetical protein
MATGRRRRNQAADLTVSNYLSAVNQKLLFAEQLSTLLDKAASNHHVEMAVAQSITVQLHQAWVWHLQDMASNYRLKDPAAVSNTSDLVNALQGEGKQPTEAAELHNLASQRGSWVISLLNAHRQLYLLPELRRAQMDADRLPVLAIDTLSSVSAETGNWDLAEVRDWMVKMRELVERHRDMMVEF